MPLLTISKLAKFYGPDQILQDVTFKLERGEHIALVGSNGTGKSTLLRIIAGAESHDSGQVSLARNTLVTYVSQHAQFESSHTLWEAMLQTFADVIDSQAQMRRVEATMAAGDLSDELHEKYRRLSTVAEHGGFDYESRIERVLTGLELDSTKWTQPVSQLSGGQKTRANLARALLKESDLLLLDEPTNHLDVGAIQWLEKYLQTQRHAYIVVAHDRYFLQSVSRRTLELAFRRLEDYPASYTGYLRLREERQIQARQAYQRQQEHISATEEFVRRFGAGQRSQEAKGRQRRLDRLERLERPRDERKLKLNAVTSARKGDSVLRLDHLSAGYGRTTIIRGPDELIVAPGARVAIVGPNGAGKTTLIRTLVGQLRPISGHFVWAPGVVPAYYAQSTTNIFDPNQTVIQTFESRFRIGDEAARSYLGRFLFSGDEVEKLVRDLSGGERSRLALAELLYSHPDVMLLDEPTNHLDISAREALEEALTLFGGSILLVSHDRFLIDKIATEIWAVDEGRIAVYDGGWSDFESGRNRRQLSYSATAQKSPNPNVQSDLTPAKPSVPTQSTGVIAAELAHIQHSLIQVLVTGEKESPTATVEQLDKAVDRYTEMSRAIRELTESLIGSSN